MRVLSYPTLAHIARPILCMALLAASASANPQASLPKNLSRTHLGATIRANSGNPSPNLPAIKREVGTANDPSFLLSDDKTLNYAVGKGGSSFIINLPMTDVLNEFSFFSYSAAGSVTIFTSSVELPFESPRWRVASASVPFRAKASASVFLNFTESRYVKVVLDSKQAGYVASFSVFGTLRLGDYGYRERRQNTTTRIEEVKRLHPMQAFNYSDAYTGSRIIYVSSAASSAPASSMVDDNPRTFYTFSSADKSPTTIVEMMEPTRIKRVTSLVVGPPGKLEVYVLSKLPFESTASLNFRTAAVAAALDGKPANAQVDAPGYIPVGTPIPKSFFDNNRPIYTTTVQPDGRAMVDFEMISGRYIMLRFLPVGISPSAKTGVNLSRFVAGVSDDLGASSDPNALKIFEIGAFGDNPQVEFYRRNYPYGTQPVGFYPPTGSQFPPGSPFNPPGGSPPFWGFPPSGGMPPGQPPFWGFPPGGGIPPQPPRLPPDPTPPPPVSP